MCVFGGGGHVGEEVEKSAQMGLKKLGGGEEELVESSANNLGEEGREEAEWCREPVSTGQCPRELVDRNHLKSCEDQ